MAVMIPDDVDQFSTDGERQFYGFLKTAAKLDNRSPVMLLLKENT